MNNGKICVSICAEKAEEFIQNIKRAAEIADVIELRFDCLAEISHEALWSRIKSIRESFKGEFLATFRPLKQGGKREISLEERQEFWLNSHVYEFVDWSDFELDLCKDDWHKYFRAVLNRIFRSYHDFSGVPANLLEIYENLADLTNYEHPLKDSDVVKIAVQADDISDSLAVWKLLEKARIENKQIIPIAMGEAGRWTRILGLANGAFMTYASLDAGKGTAAGQTTVQEMIDVYRVKELNEATEIYGIIGNPVSHSLSPFIHNAAFKFHNLNAVYIPFEVKNLDAFVKRMVKPQTRELDWNLKGFSVTIPHKQTIIKYLDETDETSRKIGAVNTVKIENGKLYGFNTDADGFIASLINLYGDLYGARVAVLGAGGAARACIYALKKEGADVFVFARNIKKAENLIEEFQIKLEELRKNKLRDFDIVVNTTPLGTAGEFENETPIISEQILNVKLALDLIYNPQKTQFMREAEKSDIPVFNGLEMLISQAMMQFKIWTGRDAPMQLMMSAAMKKLNNNQ